MPTQIELLLTRRSVPPVLLREPGPQDAELEQMLAASVRVPDHGKLAPWRIRLIRGAARERMGLLLEEIYAAAHPDATPEQLAFERDRFTRAPLVACVISSAREHVKIPTWEQTLSSAAVCMNMLHAARALGYAGCWLTEWYAYDEAVRRALGVAEDENIAGFIYIGTAESVPEDRRRPVLAEVVGEWTGPVERAEG